MFEEVVHDVYRDSVSYILVEGQTDKFTIEQEFTIPANGKIEIHFTQSITSLESFFDAYYDDNDKNIISIDFSNFDSSSLAIVALLCNDCSSLKEINFTNFNTAQVTAMNHMFSGCASLQYLNLSNFDTAQVTNMGNMFYGCSSLQYLNISHFDTA